MFGIHTNILITSRNRKVVFILTRGEKGQPLQFLVRTTFFLFSRPSHLKILLLSNIFFLSVRSLKIRILFENLFTLGNKWNIKFSLTNFKFVKQCICSQNNVVQISICLQYSPFREECCKFWWNSIKTTVSILTLYFRPHDLNTVWIHRVATDKL